MTTLDTINLADFSPTGKLGQLFIRAKTYNHINAQLVKLLPNTLNSLELCAIEKGTATLITNNQALAFRAQQQTDVIINALQQIPESGNIQQISIKIKLI